jgi:hypothetical protein
MRAARYDGVGSATSRCPRTGRPGARGKRRRSAEIAATPVPTILAADPGNRLVALDEIESAVLSQHLGICRLKLRLTDGARVKFIWLNSSRMNANYDEATKALTDLLPERFRAS